LRELTSDMATLRPQTVLLTGFEPFGGESVNPSWLIASALDGETVAGATVRAVRLPTEFRGSLRVLRAAAAHACVGALGAQFEAALRLHVRLGVYGVEKPAATVAVATLSKKEASF
jgi:hypothetical protein